MQRVRMSLPYYERSGWDVVVLAVSAEDVAATQEPELNATVPANCRITRCRTRCWNWLRFVGCGTLGWRAWWPLFRAGRRLLRNEHFDLVYFSNTQFLTFFLGPIWRWLCGVPYAIDIQDPWLTDAYDQPNAPRPPGGWKYRIAWWIAKLAESPVYRHAAGFISVSPRYLTDLQARYPWFGRKPQTHIPFGFAPDDYRLAQTMHTSVMALRQAPDERILLYTGAAGPMLPHAANILFAALAQLRQQAPSQTNRLRLHFVGTRYVSNTDAQPCLLPIAAGYGVADLVREVPYRLGQLDSLRLLDQADILLLPGSVDPAYSPSKIYAYWFASKPILGVVRAGSQLQSLLSAMGGACTVTFDTSETAMAQARTDLTTALAAIAQGQALALAPRNDHWFTRHCLAENLTQQQCELFDRCSSTIARNSA